MTAVALKGLLGRKLRSILTGLAIALGVAMISGTYILTDTINQAFTNVFNVSYRHTDALISGKQFVSNANSIPTVAASVLTRVDTEAEARAPVRDRGAVAIDECHRVEQVRAAGRRDIRQRTNPPKY